MPLVISPAKKLQGTLRVPGDKSISHRAVMIGSLATGKTEIEGFLPGEDCLSTIRCMRALGVPIRRVRDLVTVEGQGLQGLQEPADILDVGNSGTTIRLISGILAGQPFLSVLTGDSSIRRRPMGRVVKPLREMGAFIQGRQGGGFAPLTIQGGKLKPLTYHSLVASAQVKSAILLAGLFASGWTEVREPALSRNHTELMLKAFGAEIEGERTSTRIKGGAMLNGRKVTVPGDISSAAFFIVAGLIMPDARIIIENVGLNPTRDGIIEALRAMGAHLSIYDTQVVAGELMGTIEVQNSSLQGIQVGGAVIPRLIDEIPILAVAALFAKGVTEIRDAAELKVKESNRIQAICEGLTRLGGHVEELTDGLRIYGGKPLYGGVCHSRNDHRIAMSLAIAGLRAQGETRVGEAESINISFPRFSEILNGLKKEQ